MLRHRVIFRRAVYIKMLNSEQQFFKTLSIFHLRSTMSDREFLADKYIRITHDIARSTLIPPKISYDGIANDVASCSWNESALPYEKKNWKSWIYSREVVEEETRRCRFYFQKVILSRSVSG